MLFKRRLFHLKPLLKRVRTFEIGSLETLPGPNKNTWRWPDIKICKKCLVSGFNCSLVWTGSKLLHLWPSTGNQPSSRHQLISSDTFFPHAFVRNEPVQQASCFSFPTKTSNSIGGLALVERVKSQRYSTSAGCWNHLTLHEVCSTFTNYNVINHRHPSVTVVEKHTHNVPSIQQPWKSNMMSLRHF